jgi:endonuclease III
MSEMRLLQVLAQMYPNAQCELVHQSPFELLISVILSAQTTDKAVNLVTPALFQKFPTPVEMATASIADLEEALKQIGLFRNKAKHIKETAAMLVEVFDGQVPMTRSALMKLPGVGRKTANVVLSVAFGIPAVPVDTHVERIAKRLGLAKEADTVLVVEKKLQRKIPRDLWNVSHHQMIHFGRYFCTAQNPHCEACLLTNECKYFRKLSKTKQKNPSKN